MSHISRLLLTQALSRLVTFGEIGVCRVMLLVLQRCLLSVLLKPRTNLRELWQVHNKLVPGVRAACALAGGCLAEQRW